MTAPDGDLVAVNAATEEIDQAKARLCEKFPGWNIVRTGRGRWFACRGPLVREDLDRRTSIEAGTADDLAEKIRAVECAGDPQPGDTTQTFVALRDRFPGWHIRYRDGGALPWEAERIGLRSPGGVHRIVAADPEELREWLTAATMINTSCPDWLP